MVAIYGVEILCRIEIVKKWLFHSRARIVRMQKKKTLKSLELSSILCQLAIKRTLTIYCTRVKGIASRREQHVLVCHLPKLKTFVSA